MGTDEFNAGGRGGGNPIQGGLEILPVASCYYGNRDKLRPDEQLGSYADFTIHTRLKSFCILQIIPRCTTRLYLPNKY